MTRLSQEIKKEGKKGDKTVEIPLQLVKTNDSFSCPAVSLKCLHHFTKSTPSTPGLDPIFSCNAKASGCQSCDTSYKGVCSRKVREFSSSRFVLLDKSRDKNHPYLYGKVSDPETIVKENYDCPIEVGVNVDIFPIDGLPDDKKESDRLCEKLKKLRRMLEVKRLYVSKDRPLWKNILHVSGKLILLPVPDRCILRHIGKLQQRYPYENASWVADLNFGGKERRVPKSLFERTVEVDFEGGKFWVPEGYDTWLRSIFGDYMQLPPEEKRVSNHFFEVYHK